MSVTYDERIVRVCAHYLPLLLLMGLKINKKGMPYGRTAAQRALVEAIESRCHVLSPRGEKWVEVPENREKYACRMLLAGKLGMNGPEYADIRAALLKNCHGPANGRGV